MTGDYTRIARALNFIADRVDDQPELEAIAGEVGLKHFLDVLSDAQRRHRLQVGMPFEKDDALDDLVGVVHLVDGFLVFLLGKLRHAPIGQHPRMQEVLVDGGQLVLEDAVQVFDRLGVGAGAFHSAT